MGVNTPSIAFVIPAYNAAGQIAEAVVSARRQTVCAREIIVVDDGSQDNTAEIAERAGAHVIRQANGGPAAARNTGIRATNAEWIALLDADDVCFPHRLERQLPYLGRAAVAVVSGRTATGPGTRVVHPDKIDFEALWHRNYVPTTMAVVRKAAWQGAGGFDEAREMIGVEDYNLWLRLARAGWQFVVVPEALGEYRPLPNSLTAQTRQFATAELFNVHSIATQFGLSIGAVRSREYSIYRGYGLELFQSRDWPGARAFLLEAALRGRLSWRERLRLWVTLLPAPKRSQSEQR